MRDIGVCPYCAIKATPRKYLTGTKPPKGLLEGKYYICEKCNFTWGECTEEALTSLRGE
jgi:hypothetical protein